MKKNIVDKIEAFIRNYCSEALDNNKRVTTILIERFWDGECLDLGVGFQINNLQIHNVDEKKYYDEYISFVIGEEKQEMKEIREYFDTIEKKNYAKTLEEITKEIYDNIKNDEEFLNKINGGKYVLLKHFAYD